jgi:hypothetical protein
MSYNLALGGTAAPGFTASLPMTTADMLSALTTAPLEYRYTFTIFVCIIQCCGSGSAWIRI